MDSENYYRLVMTNPIRGNYIYKTRDIKKAGKKAFSYISKKYNLNKSIITLLDLDTNNEYKFIAMKPPYLNRQTGGATNNKEFMEKIKNITKTIDESLGTLDEAIQEKQEKDDSNNIILIAKNGVQKLEDINSKLDEINNKIDIFTGTKKKIDVKEEEDTEDKIMETIAKNIEKEEVKKEEIPIKKEENLLQPLLPPIEGENLCIIM